MGGTQEDLYLCWLHEADEPEHWVGAGDLVGVVGAVSHWDGSLTLQPGWVSQAARECAERNGVEPLRIVRWDPAKVGRS